MKTLYEVTGDIKDINTILVPRLELRALLNSYSIPCDGRMLSKAEYPFLFSEMKREHDKLPKLKGEQ